MNAKKLQFSSIDLLKYTEQVIDKQPSEPEIQEIVRLYAEALHPTHIAIAIPLDQNAEFLAHGHVPSPLTVDEFTRVWINAIHNAGINVYFKGTFSGVKGMYDFGFDKLTPIGTAETALTDGNKTWMGRVYQWLSVHLSNMKPGDMIGIVPEGTLHAFDPDFFLPLQPNPQTDYLNFYVELKKLCDAVTTVIKPIYTGYSSNLYKDIANLWIPSFLYDLVGIMSVDYYSNDQTPNSMEKDLNDLYGMYRQPIYLSEWSIPPSSVVTTDINNKMQEFFEAFARLRDKGILVGLNYFDGLDFSEGVLTDNILNDKGILVKTFFALGGENQPNPDLVKKEEPVVEPQTVEANPPVTINIEQKPSGDSSVEASVPIQSVKKTRTKQRKTIKTPRETINVEVNNTNADSQTPNTSPVPTYKLQQHDVSFLVKVGVYVIIGANATQLTNLATNYHLNNLTPYIMMVYTLLVAIAHAILDGK